MQDLAGFLPFVLIALVFWFLIIRPQRRRQQELASTQGSLAPGAQVMLGSGIYGTVAAVHDDTLQLELAPGTVVKVARQAVVRVVEPEVAGTTTHEALPGESVDHVEGHDDPDHPDGRPHGPQA